MDIFLPLGSEPGTANAEALILNMNQSFPTRTHNECLEHVVISGGRECQF
jgi:hypothetical protein